MKFGPEVYVNGVPVGSVRHVSIESEWHESVQPAPEPVAVHEYTMFFRPKITARDIYRLAGRTPPPLIHNGRKYRR